MDKLELLEREYDRLGELFNNLPYGADSLREELRRRIVKVEDAIFEERAALHEKRITILKDDFRRVA